MEADPIACGLPHREPFIFIEKVHDLQPGESATCSKFFAATEPFFAGHFPGQPVVPGVLLTEAMAQTAGLAAGRSGHSFRLSAIKLMKFLQPVLPNRTVFFSAKKIAQIGGLHQFQATARVDAEVVAEGIIVLSES